MSGYDFDAADKAALFFGVGDWYFMTDEEKARLHDEKQRLPSYGEQAQQARARNLERARLRKLKANSRQKSGAITRR